jgi:hypothetical protein
VSRASGGVWEGISGVEHAGDGGMPVAAVMVRVWNSDGREGDSAAVWVRAGEMKGERGAWAPIASVSGQ